MSGDREKDRHTDFEYYTDTAQKGFHSPLTLRYTKPMLSYGKVV
jgi:hypothetical protein